MGRREVANGLFGLLVAGGISLLGAGLQAGAASANYHLLLYSGVLSIFVGLPGLAYLFFNKPQREAVHMGNDYSINTGDISGSGNRVGHDFYGPKHRRLDDALRAQLLSEVPRNKLICMSVLQSDAESTNLAGEIASHLVSQGFKVRPSLATAMGLHFKGVMMQDEGDEFAIIVGHNG